MACPQSLFDLQALLLKSERAIEVAELFKDSGEVQHRPQRFKLQLGIAGVCGRQIAANCQRLLVQFIRALERSGPTEMRMSLFGPDTPDALVPGRQVAQGGGIVVYLRFDLLEILKSAAHHQLA